MARVYFVKRALYRSLTVIAVVLVAAWGMTAWLGAQGNQLLNRSLKLSNNQASQTATYEFSFRPADMTPIQTIVLQLCSNDPFPGTDCTAPAGLDMSRAVLQSQTGDAGFSIASSSTANELILTRAPSSSDAQQDSYVFTGVTNPSSDGSYFGRIQTFRDGDTTNQADNYGGLSFAINGGVDVNAVVPPYLLFCVGVTIDGLSCGNARGDYVNFGELSSRQARVGTMQLLAATNGLEGYTIRVAGTPLASGTNVISALNMADTSRPGVNQFGMNLRANTSPRSGSDVMGPGGGMPTSGYDKSNFYRFNSGDVIAASNAPDDLRKYTATYVVNVSKTQAPGVYVSTINYIALGSF